MFLSSAFGLRVWGNLPIPGLVPLPPGGGIDVRVRLGVMSTLACDSTSVSIYLDGDRSADIEPTLRVWRVCGGAYFRLRYSDGTEFLVHRSGSQVWATWPEPLTLEDTATYLLGPIFGFVLRLQGVPCLHASAVAVGGRAVVLVGSAGAGKSTTAGAFARRGFPVLSDDVVALKQQRSLIVQPGNPYLRLWPDSVQTLFGTADALPRLTPNWDKCYLDLTEPGYRFQARPLPLGAVYILCERRDDPSAPRVEGLNAREGLVTLVANTYTNYLLDSQMRAQEFKLLGRVLADVPLRRLIPHSDPAYLPRLCDVVIEDVQGLLDSRLTG